MKRSLLLLLILLTTALNAQDKQVIAYNQMPKYGFPFDKGWRYTPHDNPAYARPDYPDAKWDTINPSMQLYDMQHLKQANIIWLRLHFKVSKNITDSIQVFMMSQAGASEIYLDGKLIKRYGVVSNNPAKVIPVGRNLPAEALRLQAGKEHVLAIRYSPWKGAFNLRQRGYLMSLGVLSVSGYQEVKATYSQGGYIFIVLASVFVLISLLHLSFYRYDRAQRANLYFSIYTIASAICFIMVCLMNYFQDVRFHTFVSWCSFVIGLTGGIWTLRAMGILFGLAVRRSIIAMCIIYPVAVACMLWIDVMLPYYATVIIFTVINIIVAIKAFRRGKRGAGMIVGGFLASIAAFFLDVLVRAGVIPAGFIIQQTLVGLTYLGPAIGFSLYLARDFATKSAMLREKLVQVETLSAKNMEQEHEKRTLLAEQNQMLEEQVNNRTAQLQQSLAELKQTQNQLIQNEKMASLGELTAGIAHEIQNPLNFVNNFSDVSIELLDELQEEMGKGDIEEANAIACDIKDNLTKIAHHGRRADGIVKGMLQHSRTSSGQKELTDINTLADEYLRLSYHGLRAKDKSFNAEMVTHFDAALPKINVIPQDMGRVLLNLFNNAFYATQEKSKQSQSQFTGSYKPTVQVSTRLTGNSVEIVVKDNGTGVPDAIKDKILQPFFTTKPTGQGTGLGLSLSYDIVVKAHGGTIDVESKEGGGAVFKINLPLNA